VYVYSKKTRAGNTNVFPHRTAPVRARAAYGRAAQYTRNTANFASTTTPTAAARYVSSRAHTRCWPTTSASRSKSSPNPKSGSVVRHCGGVSARACGAGRGTHGDAEEDAGERDGERARRRVHAERDAGRVEREEDGERAAGLGGEVRREVVVRDEREAGDPRELRRGGCDGEGEGRDEELVHP
jgi:hypothetical protein